MICNYSIPVVPVQVSFSEDQKENIIFFCSNNSMKPLFDLFDCLLSLCFLWGMADSEMGGGGGSGK